MRRQHHGYLSESTRSGDGPRIRFQARERRSQTATNRSTAALPERRTRLPSLATEEAQRRVAEDVRVAVVETQRALQGPVLKRIFTIYPSGAFSIKWHHSSKHLLI